MRRLWYNSPAIEWEEALPIGNGRLGAMIYGGVNKEIIQVNEESMFLGAPRDRINPDARKNLSKVREFLDNGEIGKAEKLLTLAFSGVPEGVHSYQTLGEIQLFFEDQINSTDYVRDLNLNTALTQVSYKCGDITYTREIFASKPADSIIMKIKSDKPKSIDLSARLRRGQWFDGISKIENCGIRLYGNLGKGGFDFASELRAKTIDGEVSVIGETLLVEKASEVILIFTADTTYHNENIEESIQNKFDNIWNKSYEELLSEHIEDYQGLFSRVDFHLDEIEKYEDEPTNERLKKSEPDIGLSNLLYDFGRYLTIAGSRKGDLPLTLQGLWNKDFFAPWDSKYTININTEMNYWHVEASDLSECHEPLFELLKKVQINGEKTAREMYGCRGFVAHHNTDMHGDTAPQDIWIPSSYWPMGGAWLSTHLWIHYCFTLDKEFLKEVFPIMLDAALFFVDFLIEKDGYLVTSPSVSPENVYILPSGEKGACCIGPTMDNQILRHLFGQCIDAWNELEQKVPEACVVRDVDNINNLIEEIKKCNEKLRPNQISESGRIMEWMEDYEEEEPGHRHISHLYGLFPGCQITVDETPKLCNAAKETLKFRLSHGGGHTGWSRAWIMNHYASLWEADEAYKNIELMLEHSTYPNMFDKHPPFQIDGNFGAVSAINRMLVQSRRDKVFILPALPEKWKSGYVKGIKIMGNAKMNISWENGKLVSCEVFAGSDYTTTFIYDDKKEVVSMEANHRYNLSF